jgi:hypothetical protein
MGAVLAVACKPLLPVAARLTAPCALHALTGVPCFACGTTRAALALAHGDGWRALTLNPIATLAMTGGLLGGIVAPGWVALRGPVPGIDDRSARWLRLAAWIAVAAQWAYLIAARR